MSDDLFAVAPESPLAERMRPTSLDEVIGQSHLVGVGRPLRAAIDGQHLPSMILWGPPGVGKTTLARILAQSVDAQFLPLSAVFSGVKDIRDAIFQANQALQRGQKTILFVDEVHRFNKAQQDAFLPYVENGLIVFIGATTENPSFEVNSALLSRAQVYTLQSLSEDDLRQLTDRVMHLPEYQALSLADDAQALLMAHANGDARRLLNSLEQVLETAQAQEHMQIDYAFTEQLLGSRVHHFDKGGDQFYDLISALHKSVRGSHPDAALYWFCRMLEGGVDPHYLARRIVRIAWEDIGLADPRAIQLANDAAATYERLGSPEGELALAEAVLYLASAAKSNAAYVAYNRARAYVAKNPSHPVPLHLRNAPTALMKAMDYHKNYRYAHDEPYAYAAGEEYMPDGVEEPLFFEPTDRGIEKKIQEKLQWLKSLDYGAEK